MHSCGKLAARAAIVLASAALDSPLHRWQLQNAELIRGGTRLLEPGACDEASGLLAGSATALDATSAALLEPLEAVLARRGDRDSLEWKKYTDAIRSRGSDAVFDEGSEHVVKDVLECLEGLRGDGGEVLGLK